MSWWSFKVRRNPAPSYAGPEMNSYNINKGIRYLGIPNQLFFFLSLIPCKTPEIILTTQGKPETI